MAFASYVIFKYIVPSMSKSLKKNYISAVLNQVLSAVIQTVALFYISRALAAPEIGEYSYAVSVCSYFILLSNLGFVAYGQREIAFLRDDKDAYSKVFAELFCLKLIISAVVMSAYAAFIFLFAKDKLLYTIIIIQIVNSMLDISWLYTGLEYVCERTLTVSQYKALMKSKSPRHRDYLRILQYGFYSEQQFNVWRYAIHLQDQD